MPIIEVNELVKNFRTFRRRSGLWGSFKDLVNRKYQIVRAVNRISFSIEPGEVVGYIGANGAGKSTTIKMLTGILVPTSGSISVQGLVPYKTKIPARKADRGGVRPAHPVMVGHRGDRGLAPAAEDLRDPDGAISRPG